MKPASLQLYRKRLACREVMKRGTCTGKGGSPIHDPSATSQALQHTLANATPEATAGRTSHSLEHDSSTSRSWCF